MSVEALSWAKRTTAGGANRKAVLMVLADYADEDGSCYPGQERIAAESEVSVRTVRRILAEFEERGLIVRKARGVPGGGRTSDRIYLVMGAGGNAASLSPLPPIPATDATKPASGDTETGQSLAGEPSGEPPVEPSDNARSLDEIADELAARLVKGWPKRPNGADRLGGRKNVAKAIKRRLREGIKPETIITAATRYREWVNRARRKRADTESLMLATFVGPGGRIEDWADRDPGPVEADEGGVRMIDGVAHRFSPGSGWVPER